MNDFTTLKEFLELPLYNSDPIFDKFANLPNMDIVLRGKKPHRFLYIRGKRENKVVLVAHADTVWDEYYSNDFDPQSQVLFIDGMFQSSSDICGIGADDRAGCAMLWLLKDLGHSLLITDGEEGGLMGSKWLMKDISNLDIAEEINHKHQFMIQLDRRYSSDFKCYSVGTDEFREYVKKVTGYSEPDRVASTDIVQLCQDITGVNLSVGYRYEHSHKECLSFAEWQNTLNICRQWLSQPNLPRFSRY